MLTSSQPPSGAFAAAFREALAGRDAMTFEAFCALALYHPSAGYYTDAARLRVGKEGADFYTASSLGPVFGKLVAEACARGISSAGVDPASATLVEIGCERGRGVLGACPGAFGRHVELPLGADLDLSGPCAVFSNELFDAQPFSRWHFRDGAWREACVRLGSDGLLHETLDGPGGPVPEELAACDAPEGWVVDHPSGAARLLRRLAAPGWHGFFLALDYGCTLGHMLSGCPEGTARAYVRHTQHNRLLDDPGAQDLTHHVAWDLLEDVLRQCGFSDVRTERQEACLMRMAPDAIRAAASGAGFSVERRALMALLHPAHMGSRFQALTAVRRA